MLAQLGGGERTGEMAPVNYGDRMISVRFFLLLKAHYLVIAS